MIIPQPVSCRVILGFACIVLTGAVAYFPSLGGDFIRDDKDLIKNNEYIREWKHLPKIFTHDVAAGSRSYHGFYRPIQMFTYSMEYALWKDNPLPYHITNTVLHLMASMLLFKLLLVMFEPFPAFAAALLYTVHPIHSEAVMYISGRNDPLSLVFMLLTYILYLKGLNSDSHWRTTWICVCFVLALLSKETSIIFPFFILIYHISFHTMPQWKRVVPLLLMAMAFLILRVTILSSKTIDMGWAIKSLPERVPGFFVAISYYLQLLIWPSDLYFRFGMPLFPLFCARSLLGMFLILALLSSALYSRHRNHRVCFFILWFLCGLIPVSNLYPSTYFMTEHWMYVPSIGFFAMVGLAIERVLRVAGSTGASFTVQRLLQGVLIASVFPLAALYALRTMGQSGYWKDTVTFYQRTIERQPDHGDHYFWLGEHYKVTGDMDRAIQCYEKAMELDPSDIGATGNLANLLQQAGDIDRAIPLYRRILSMENSEPLVYVNLGNALDKKGDTLRAIESYRQAIELDSSLGIAHFNLGLALVKTGDYKQASSSFQKAVEFSPELSTTWYYLGICALKEGNLSEAKRLCALSEKLGLDIQVLQSGIQEAMEDLPGR